MADPTAGLGALLQSPEGQQAMQQLAGLLGSAGGTAGPQPTPTQPASSAPDLNALMAALQGAMDHGTPAAAPPEPAAAGGLDLSALVGAVQSALGSSSAPAQAPAAVSGPPAEQGGTGLDLSALMGTVQNALAQAQSTPAPSSGGIGGMDLSGLAQMLQGAMGGGGGSGGPALDPELLLLAQRAYSAYTARDKNTELLLALRPHFTEERQKKVDDAIRILGLLRLLPLVKESGLLDKLGNLLGGEGK